MPGHDRPPTAQRLIVATDSFPIVKGTAAFRRLSWAMLAAGFSTFAVLYGVQPLLPLFAAEFGLTPAEASLAISIATGPLAVAILIAGPMSDLVGRRPLMIVSLFAAALLTLATGLLAGWTTLLGLRLMTGIALAGIPSVAVVYLADEVDRSSLGSSVGLYISGAAIGGMTGRLVVSILADYAGWRASLIALGLAALLSAIVFWRLSPQPRGFTPRRYSIRGILMTIGTLLKDPGLRLLFMAGALVMGIFVTIYNFTSFRLIAPPYRLDHSAVGAIFLLYILGSASSALFGSLSGRLSRRHTFWMPAMLALIGALLTAASPLPAIIAGIGITTIGIFGIHAIASAWVSHRAGAERGTASAIYLFGYYMGGSVMGPIGGVAWARMGWPGVVLFTGTLAALVLVVALLLIRVQPLPENLHRPEEDQELPPG